MYWKNVTKDAEKMQKLMLSIKLLREDAKKDADNL